MEKQVQILTEGDELQQDDVNRMGEAAGLADDRVFAELLRLKPYGSTQKAILPYAVSGGAAYTALTSTALVSGNVADSRVRVMPFRAFVSSIDNSTATEEVRGIRSGLYVGSSTIYQTVTITANAAGDPRWTLVYAVVTPNANGAAENRYNKDPGTLVVASNSRVTYKRTTVTVTTLDGATGVTPVKPTLPADAAGNYYIALAFVWIPAGFGAAQAELRQYLRAAAPCIAFNGATGCVSLEVANQQFTSGGVVDTQQLDATQQYRPGAYLPATMQGGAARVFAFQVGLAPESHLDGSIADSSLDWRFRYFKWTVGVRNGSTSASGFASDRQATGANLCPSAIFSVLGSTCTVGMGQSFVDDTALGVAWTSAPVNPVGAAVYLNLTTVSALGAANSFLMLFVDTSGRLIFKMQSPVSAQVMVWLEATAPYGNFGTV